MISLLVFLPVSFWKHPGVIRQRSRAAEINLNDFTLINHFILCSKPFLNSWKLLRTCHMVGRKRTRERQDHLLSIMVPGAIQRSYVILYLVFVGQRPSGQSFTEEDTRLRGWRNSTEPHTRRWTGGIAPETKLSHWIRLEKEAGVVSLCLYVHPCVAFAFLLH